MSDGEKKSEDDEVEREPVYYYSREHRLSRASQSVRALYDDKYVRPSLTKTLFGTKGNIFILISILVICVMFTISNRLTARGASVKLGGNTLALSVIREEGILGLGIAKTVPRSGEFYIGAVDIAVTPVMPQLREGETPGEVPPVLSHRVYFNPRDTESFFISLPFDGDEFYVFLNTDNEQKAVRLR